MPPAFVVGAWKDAKPDQTAVIKNSLAMSRSENSKLRDKVAEYELELKRVKKKLTHAISGFNMPLKSVEKAVQATTLSNVALNQTDGDPYAEPDSDLDDDPIDT